MKRVLIEEEHWPVYTFETDRAHSFDHVGVMVEVDGEFIARFRNAKSEWNAVQRVAAKLYEEARRAVS